MTQTRQPEGIPTGGQYATQVKSDNVVALAPRDVEYMPAADMTQEEIQRWVASQVSHHISPVIGWIRLDAEDGLDTEKHLVSLEERMQRVGATVAERFSSTPPGLTARSEASSMVETAIEEKLGPLFKQLFNATGNQRIDSVQWRTGIQEVANSVSKQLTGPAPILDGFTADEVEEKLIMDWHQDQCGCDLKDDICSTPSYGEKWRGSAYCGIPNVHAVFDAIEEMAARR